LVFVVGEGGCAFLWGEGFLEGGGVFVFGGWFVIWVVVFLSGWRVFFFFFLGLCFVVVCGGCFFFLFFCFFLGVCGVCFFSFLVFPDFFSHSKLRAV